MDGLIKGELGKEAVEADRKLSRLQNFTLDAVAPLVAALEELMEKEEPDPAAVTSAIQLGLRFLGNASAQFSVERRGKALTRLNPDLKSMAEDKDFSPAPPFLFGLGFEKKAKERSEALECLQKAVAKPNTHGQASSSSYHGSAPRKRFFRGAHSHGRFQGRSGSGNNYYRPHYHNRGPPGPSQSAAAKKA